MTLAGASMVASGAFHSSGSEIYDLTTDLFKLQVCADQFRHVDDPLAQRELFKRFVKRLVIETSSYCNRRCVFCPNTDGSRIKHRSLMPDADFNDLIDDLAEIEFAGTILFHLYNEPLANPAIFRQIAQARRALPNAVLSFNSNGDYIRAGTLEKLAEAGLTRLHISIYGPAHGRFEMEDITKRVADMAELCGFDRSRAKQVNALECRANGTFMLGDKAMPIVIQGRDFNETGYDRGGLVQIKAPLPRRMDPCPAPFDEVNIGWNGVAVPCCNIVTDKPEHESYSVGKAKGRGAIFSIYASGPLVEWRRSLLKFAPHGGPCVECTRISNPIPMLGEEHFEFNKNIDILLAQAGI